MSMARKLHHASYIVQPGQNFVHSLLRFTNLHLTGEQSKGGLGRMAHTMMQKRKSVRSDMGWW